MLPAYILTLNTVRITDLRFSAGIEEKGSLNGIAYNDGAGVQLLNGVLDSEDRSFTFTSNDSIGFNTVLFYPITPLYNFKEPDTDIISATEYIISGIDSVTFDTATTIPEPETYAM